MFALKLWFVYTNVYFVISLQTCFCTFLYCTKVELQSICNKVLMYKLTKQLVTFYLLTVVVV